MSYIERYVAGQFEEVWEELVALGPDVLEEPLYQDALAVAREMMGRVRRNIEQLIPRLIEIGYAFGYDHLIREMLRKPLRPSRWEDYLRARAWVGAQPPIFMPAQMREEMRLEVEELGLADLANDLDMVSDQNTPPDMSDLVKVLDRDAGPMPLTLRAWYEQVGAANLCGYHSGWVQHLEIAHRYPESAPRYLIEGCDPLQVRALDESSVSELIKRRQQGSIVQLEFAPDRHEKSYSSGSSTPHAIDLSNAEFDGRLADSPRETFVQYLRRCFRWAGFPGMAEWPSAPASDLAFLTQGLLPF